MRNLTILRLHQWNMESTHPVIRDITLAASSSVEKWSDLKAVADGEFERTVMTSPEFALCPKLEVLEFGVYHGGGDESGIDKYATFDGSDEWDV